MAVLCVALPPVQGHSGESLIVPNTKLRVSVIQWMPTKGVFEPWSALGGEFMVAEDGQVRLPVVGP